MSAAAETGPAAAAFRAELSRLAESCIHCGLCLEDCPTYHELGNEMDSPRGRILLMRGWAEGRAAITPLVRTHLDRCLDCRACETACPSGVQYGALIEHARAHLPPPSDDSRPSFATRLRDWLIFEVLPRPRRLRMAVWLGRIAERLGIADVAGLIFPALAPLTRMLPRRGGTASTVAALPPEQALPNGPRRADVQLFSGCATSVLTPGTLSNAQRVLLHNGCAVACPRAQGCCGAIHHHGGRIGDAQRMARANIDVFEEAASTAPIVTVAAGCGAMLRQYDRLLADDPHYATRARAFVARIRDVSEFLWQLGPVPPTRSSPDAAMRRVTYHDPCHLIHAQRVSNAPRALLRMIPGVELIECRESSMCCGAAGTYNLLQPAIAGDLGRRKLANLAASGASIVATGNIGCIMHLQALQAQTRGAPTSAMPADVAAPQVVHTIDLLHEAYGLSPSGTPPAAH